MRVNDYLGFPYPKGSLHKRLNLRMSLSVFQFSYPLTLQIFNNLNSQGSLV